MFFHPSNKDQKRVVLAIGKFCLTRCQPFHAGGDPEETLVFSDHAWTQSIAGNRQRQGEHTIFLSLTNTLASVTSHLLTDGGVDTIHTHDDIPFVRRAVHAVSHNTVF
jgi:hypothetical protein